MESRSRIDWTHTPLEEFFAKPAGKSNQMVSYPHGRGEAQEIMLTILAIIGSAYEKFIPYETDGDGNVNAGDDALRWERTGEVPIIRDGRREYIELDSIKLADLPDLLDTLVILEKEYIEREREERERKKAERRNRERVRAKERRKLKKLGEW